MILSKKENILFNRWKEVLIRRYGSSLDEEFALEAHENIVLAYNQFIASGCADSNFKDEICSSDENTSAQRLGEMLFYEKLTHLGLEPISQDVGPDFKVEIDGKTIWLELITPGIGEDKRISELLDSDPLRPCPYESEELRNRLLLRVSHAISEKLIKYEKYLRDGIVPAGDPLIIVLNDALLCSDSPFYGVSHNAEDGVGGTSLAEHAVYGIGPSRWVQENDLGKYISQRTYRDIVDNRPEPKKGGGVRGAVPVNIFGAPSEENSQLIAERAKIISAVYQLTLREDYGVLMHLRKKAETEDRLCETLLSKGKFVVNRNSRNPIDFRIQHRLKTVVVAPALSHRELWDLEVRRLRSIFGPGVPDQPFPG